MIDIYIDIGRDKIRDNLDVIFGAFFCACYNVNVRNLKIAIYTKVKNEILSQKMPDINHADKVKYFVAANVKPGYYKPTGKKEPDMIQETLVIHEDFIAEFPKSASEKMMRFIKSGAWSLNISQPALKNLEYVIVKCD